MTTHGPALITVTGVTVPSSAKICVIPTFLPIIPLTMRASHLRRAGASPPYRSRRPREGPGRLFVLLAEGLDLDVHACRKVELHERVDRLGRRVEDVHQPLVRPDLELLARFLVDVRAAKHRVLVLDGGQRDRPRHARAGALRGVHDLRGRLVENAVIVCLQPDSNLFVKHNFSSSGRGRWPVVALSDHWPPSTTR